MENYASSKLMESKVLMNREKFSPSVKDSDKSEKAQLEKACKDFEAIMMNQMLKSMRETVPKEGGMMPDSHGIDIWESIYDEKLTSQVSGGEKGTGLARFLYEQLSTEDFVKLKS
ncbi:MAG: rod-binding protein [Thermodesulfobacteriota bacterium]